MSDQQTNEAVTEAEVTALRERVNRLERRVIRERNARLEAEQIAENGMLALFKANQELDQRIMDRTRELDAALDEVTAAGRSRSQFLAHMSHHLMTPLNGVVGMLDLLGKATYEPHEQAWHSSALRSANRLDRLIRQMTAYTEIDGVDLRRDAPLRPVGEVLHAIENDWRQAMLRAGQLPMFETAGFDHALIATPPQVFMMFSELIDNVVKHAEPGPVRVVVREVTERMIAIDIIAPGSGVIPEHDVAEAGQIEQQGDRPAGFGLVLVRAIASALGGRITVPEDVTSMVTVELPLGLADSASASL